MPAVAYGPLPPGVIAHLPSGSPTEARAASDAEPGMGSRLQVPRWGRGAQSGQHSPNPGGVTSYPASSDSEKLLVTGDLSQRVVHPQLSREGVAADGGGGGQIPEGPARGGGVLWTTQGELGRQVREIHMSTTKEAEGLPAWDLALRFPLEHPRPMGCPSGPKSLGRIPYPCPPQSSLSQRPTN